MLQVQNLTITFPGAPAPAVNDLSFELAAGGRLGLLGLSGSGKSLTAMALLGLLPASATITQGEAWYQPLTGPAIDLLQQTETDWRRLRGKEISLVFQEPLTALNPVHRIEKQLLETVRQFCPELTTEKDRAAYVRAWLTKVELIQEHERLLNAYPHQLSGGQRQRLLIALALLGKPRLLLADEPTTALDVITEAGILQLLEQLRQELNMASLFITHDLDVMQQSADHLLVLAAGKTLKRGTTREILALGDQLFLPAGESVNSVGPTKENEHRAADKKEEVQALLTVKDLRLTYPGPKNWFWSKAKNKIAVQEVSFSLYPGEWLAIVGPSGCGKTSLARCLAGLMTKTGGSVETRPHASVQMVFQDPFSSLNPAHTVREAILEVLRITWRESSHRANRLEAERLLAEVGLPAETFANRKPAALSGGQRQRVAIARALAGAPEIMIADESVSALDAPLRHEVLGLLDRLRQEHHFGLLFISHDLGLVAEWADRVLIMEAGSIVEQGPAATVFRAPQSEMGRRLVAARPNFAE